ncbi:MAG TPA: PAS domain S-box protein [Myxococcota bacterium]|nr:PAS domain S-box protein [Myxococcota bacterium]
MLARVLRLLRRVSGLGSDPNVLRDLLETTPNLIGVEIEERVAYANRTALRLLGVATRAEIRQRSICDFVHPDDRAHVREAAARVHTRREAVPSLELRLVASDGTILDVEAWLAPIRYRGKDAMLIQGRDRSARRRAAARLRESEAGYRRLAEHSSDIISEHTASGDLIYVSPSIERVLGYSPERWANELSKQVHTLTHPDDLPRAWALLATGELPPAPEILQRIRHADGEYRWLHTHGRRFESADGRRKVVMVTRDVTEEQRTVEALRESEQRFQSLARAVPVGIFRIDRKGRHVYMNERWSELTGIPVETALANPGSRPLHPEDDGKILKVARRALAEGVPLRLEQRIVRPDGEVRWVLTQAMPEFDAAGAFAGWVGTLTDLSDKRASEQALAESEARLRLALEGAQMCTWEWDAPAGVVRWSPNAARVFGLGDGEAMPGTTDGAATLVNADDFQAARSVALERAERGESFELEFRLAPRAGGQTRWVLVRGHAVKERPGISLGVVADVTLGRRFAEERAELEARLRESQRLESLGLLAGGVAHDFNNLLVGILGNAELGLQRPIADPGLRECLEEVQRAGERAAGLVRQILAFSGRERIDSERVDLRALVGDTLELLRHSLPARAKIDWSAPLEPAAVDGDATQLRQVLMNLVTNACEALPAEGGLVTLRVTTSAGAEGDPTPWLALEVADSGCGVDDAALARIFDPFFTTKGAGRGLGLAVAHGIVRAHRGSLSVDSAAGRGTRMRVLLPAAAHAPVAPGAPAEVAQPAAAHGEGAILIVDDERGVREVARRALEGVGYSVLLAADRGEALAQLRAHGAEISAIVLDLTLGGESGELVLAELRELAGKTPVLATSGYAAEPALRRLEAQGIAGFVQKPFTATSLANSIAGVLRASLS